jgi:hypothetical protein
LIREKDDDRMSMYGSVGEKVEEFDEGVKWIMHRRMEAREMFNLERQVGRRGGNGYRSGKKWK